MTFQQDAVVVNAALRNGGPMRYVSLLVEALRSRPTFMFWVAALSQGLIWTLVPTLFYTAPPGDIPLQLAIGREWTLGSFYGPPMSYWLAEGAFALSGQRMVGVYLLSQLCIVVTYWAVFALGRAIVGAAHALMAVLLMVGIIAFSVPTPEFGPNILATPLSALALLYLWRAVGESRPAYWYALAVDLGLLLLTTYVGALLLVAMILFVSATARGRASLATMHPWIAGLVILLAVMPHLLWLDFVNAVPSLGDLPDLRMIEGRYPALLRMALWLVVAHAGLVVLVAAAGGLRFGPKPPAPVFERPRDDPFAKRFVYFFALAPAASAVVIAVLSDRAPTVGAAAPLVPLTGLAVIIAAGPAIKLHRQRILGLAWLGLLAVPALATAAGTILLPWFMATDLAIGRPAAAMGQFFTDAFRRRTGQRLEVVVGDLRIGAVVALASPDRPHFSYDQAPERTPWVTDADIRARGAILVWPVSDPAGAPPAGLLARFPEIVAEVPQGFERKIQGRLPLLRVGWAVIRPGSAAAPGGSVRSTSDQ